MEGDAMSVLRNASATLVSVATGVTIFDMCFSAILATERLSSTMLALSVMGSIAACLIGAVALRRVLLAENQNRGRNEENSI
jgi:hypothetical protein